MEPRSSQVASFSHASSLGWLCLVLFALVTPRLSAQTVAVSPRVTTPEQFLGHQIGADHFLANYTQLREYWKKLEGESDRLQLATIGTTSYGQQMLMSIISAPANLKKLARYREISGKLARARLSDVEAMALAREGKAVVWIDAGMHATESVAAQNILELVYRMVSRTDEETTQILENVILLVVPANPDGMEMVANGYMATKRVGSLPVLYQRYIGHDNNRDFYMANLPETEALNKVLYREWYPQIVYNHHQSAPRGTILFTPPFRDPFNYNFDPMVVRGIALVANHINSRFVWEQKPGIISRSGAPYSTWWNGGLRTTTYFHNMIGILTEAYGHPTPRKLTQDIKRRLPHGDYPDPIGSQEWHARQTIEYLQTANRALLLLAARYRKDFLYNIYQMGRNSIRRGSQDHWTVTPKLMAIAKQRGVKARRKDDPDISTTAVRDTFTDPALRDARAYILLADQPDLGATRRFVRILLKNGVEVHRLTRNAVIAQQRYREGSFVVLAAQAFRPHVRDMFEPQWHPDDLGSDGTPVRPYDSAGWTPSMQMDVRFDSVFEAVPAATPMTEVSLATLVPTPGVVTRGQVGFLLSGGDTANYRCVNRLLQAGQRVYCLGKSVKIGRLELPKGSYYIPKNDGTVALLRTQAKELGVDFVGVDRHLGGPALEMRNLRIGLFDVYGGNISTGWTEWLLRQNEFPVELVFGTRIHAGDLRKDFDVLIFHTGLPDPGGKGRVRRALRRGRPNRASDDQIEKLLAALPAFEDWSTAKDRRVRLTRKTAVPALTEFMAAGGVVVAMGSQSVNAARLFEVPVVDGVTTLDENGKHRPAGRSEFFIPGSLVNLKLAKNSMITTGLSHQLAGMFRRSPVFRVKDKIKVKVLATYENGPNGDPLLSGWAIGSKLLPGRAAVMEVPRGSGKLFLFGVDAVYRGQPQGTINMFFNAVSLGAAKTVSASQLR